MRLTHDWQSAAPIGADRRQTIGRFAPPLRAPDFVVELRSPSDSLPILKDKMQEYIGNGVSLGWLIDRPSQQVYVYTSTKDMQCLDNPSTVNGEPLLPGFTLNLAKIW